MNIHYSLQPSNPNFKQTQLNKYPSLHRERKGKWCSRHCNKATWTIVTTTSCNVGPQLEIEAASYCWQSSVGSAIGSQVAVSVFGQIVGQVVGFVIYKGWFVLEIFVIWWEFQWVSNEGLGCSTSHHFFWWTLLFNMIFETFLLVSIF